jgi:hypothetical protein
MKRNVSSAYSRRWTAIVRFCSRLRAHLKHVAAFSVKPITNTDLAVYNEIAMMQPGLLLQLNKDVENFVDAESSADDSAMDIEGTSTD